MAGGHGKPALLVDPAIEKWFHMRESTQHAYQFKGPRVLAISAVFMLVVPGLVYLGANKWNFKYEFRGVTRDQSYIRAENKEAAASAAAKASS